VQVPFVFANLLHVYGVKILPLGNLGNVVWVGLIAYAIARHRFMDVDYLVRKFVSFGLAAVAVLTPGTLGLIALAGHLGAKDPLLMGSAGAVLGLIAALLVPAMQKALETRVHRAFFPHRYDYRLRLRDLAAELVHVLDEHELVTRLGQAIGEVLEVERCEIYLRDPTSRLLAFAYPVRDDDAHPPESVCRELETLTEPVLTDELVASESPLVPFFRDRGWEVAVPLRIHDRLTGLLALGRDREFRLVSGEDLSLLEAVAGGASVALENARLSQELRRSEAVLQRANRLSSLGMLAAGIAHEIRNPLTAVKTFLDLLPTRIDDKEFLTHFRDLSAGELRRVTNLINDLLALGKSTTAERRPVSIESTIEPVVRLMESTARKRQLEMRIDIEPDVPEVLADADQLKQIVLNLLLNAIEASVAGGHVGLAVSCSGPDTVTIEVNDDGPGIPAAQLDTIFEPFFTTKETGTGLGLALVHQMVVEHNGEISVESEPGEGTTFRVSLPTAHAEMLRTGT
jgi:signal transduction histidine kinase